MSWQWYVAREGRKDGPYPFEQLQEWARVGMLLRGDMILPPDSTKWQTASSVPDLFQIPVAVVVAPQAAVAAPTTDPKKQVLLIAVLGGVACLILMCSGVLLLINIVGKRADSEFEKVQAELNKGMKNTGKGGTYLPKPGDEPKDRPLETEKDDKAVDVDDLIAEYDKNQVAANDKYKNKTVRVSGIINRITPQSPWIVVGFKHSKPLAIWVQCGFDIHKDKEMAARLSKGDRIVVEGTCMGAGDAKEGGFTFGTLINILDPKLIRPSFAVAPKDAPKDSPKDSPKGLLVPNKNSRLYKEGYNEGFPNGAEFKRTHNITGGRFTKEELDDITDVEKAVAETGQGRLPPRGQDRIDWVQGYKDGFREAYGPPRRSQ